MVFMMLAGWNAGKEQQPGNDQGKTAQWCNHGHKACTGITFQYEKNPQVDGTREQDDTHYHGIAGPNDGFAAIMPVKVGHDKKTYRMHELILRCCLNGGHLIRTQKFFEIVSTKGPDNDSGHGDECRQFTECAMHG